MTNFELLTQSIHTQAMLLSNTDISCDFCAYAGHPACCVDRDTCYQGIIEWLEQGADTSGK